MYHLKYSQVYTFYTQGYTVYLLLLVSCPVTPVHKPLSVEHCLLRVQKLGSDLIMGPMNACTVITN